MTPAAIAPVLFIFGLCVGSFLNVVIARLPEGRSIVSPGSACPRCGRFLQWFDNVPLISYALLGGRCRYCREPISVRYPVIELVTGLLFALAAWERGLTPDLVPALFLLTALVAITGIDLDRQLIPDAISLPGIAVGFVSSLVVGRPGWLDSLLGLLVGGVVAIVLLVMGQRGRKDALAFGPYLALGGAVSLFWGRPLLDWYLGVFSG